MIWPHTRRVGLLLALVLALAVTASVVEAQTRPPTAPPAEPTTADVATGVGVGGLGGAGGAALVIYLWMRRREEAVGKAIDELRRDHREAIQALEAKIEAQAHTITDLRVVLAQIHPPERLP